MVIPELFKDTLLSFEQIPFKPLAEHDVYNQIHKNIPEGHTDLSIEEKAELIAFRFLEPRKNEERKPGLYFLPLYVSKNEDGTSTEFPSPSMVCAETIAYWLSRLEETRHPVLAARYAGLIYDMSLQVTESKATFATAQKYAKSLLDIIEQKLFTVPVYSIGKVGRALEVSLSLNNPELIDRSKHSIIKLEQDIAIPDKPGLWGFSYDLLIDGKKKLVSETEEAAIIKDLEERFNSMLMIDSWCAECAAERLMDHYFSLKLSNEIKRLLSGLETSFANGIYGLSASHKLHYTEQLYQFYKKYQLNQEADLYLKKVREFAKDTDSEMKSISGEIKINRDKLDDYIEKILNGDNSEVILVRIIEGLTPKIKQVREELNHLIKTATLYYHLSMDLVDNKGRRIAKIPPITEDSEGHFIVHFSQTIRTNTIFLHFIFEEAIRREILTTHEIMKFLGKSCIIEKDRFPIINKGLEAYFAKDYTVAIHLLIPQFEEAIRNLVELNGGSVMVQKGEAYSLKTFEHLLNDQIITDIFGEDKAIYFKVLFTDKRGLNFRNKVAHGMLNNIDFLNKQNIDLIIHAFWTLGMVRLKESDEKRSKSI